MRTPTFLTDLISMGLKNHIISPVLGNMKSLIPFSNITILDDSFFSNDFIANDNKELSL